MASQNVAGIITLLATTALGQFEAVTLDAGGTSVSQAGAGDTVFGINQFAVAVNEMAAIHMLNRAGTFKVKAGGAVSAGASLGAATSGRWTVGAAGTQLVAMQAASAAGEILEACPGGLVVAAWPPLPSDLVARWDDVSTLVTDGNGVLSWTDSVGSVVATRVGGTGGTETTVDGRRAVAFSNANHRLVGPSAPVTAYPFMLTFVGSADLAGIRLASVGNDTTDSDSVYLDVISTNNVRGVVALLVTNLVVSGIVGDDLPHVITLVANSATDARVYVDNVAGSHKTISTSPTSWNRCSIGGGVVTGGQVGDTSAFLIHGGRTFDSSDVAAVYAASAGRWPSIP